MRGRKKESEDEKGRDKNRKREREKACVLFRKEESLACQITSPFNIKLGCYYNNIKKFAIQKRPIFFLLNGEVILPSSVYS